MRRIFSDSPSQQFITIAEDGRIRGQAYSYIPLHILSALAERHTVTVTNLGYFIHICNYRYIQP